MEARVFFALYSSLRSSLSSSLITALMAEIFSLVMETCMQVCFMVTEATIIHSQLKSWGRRYKELEKYHREGDEGVKRRMETVEYQLENEMYFIATFCQNYVPANVDFERKIFGLKITSFLVSEMTIAASAAVHMREYQEDSVIV
jgi:hypothetical protein